MATLAGTKVATQQVRSFGIAQKGTMDDITEGLGTHPSSRHEARRRWLTLHETSELIRRAGCAAGLVPQAEYKCRPPQTPIGDHGRRGTNSWKIDWVWRDDTEQDQPPKVLIEIEGRDVSREYVASDVYKLNAHWLGDATKQLRVLVLFQLKYDYTPKGARRTPDAVAWMKAQLPDLLVYTDEELVAGGRIHELVAKAKALL